MANVVPHVDDIEFHEEEKALSFAYREPTLPDVSLIHGRMLLMAWEEGLESVEERAVELVKTAVEMQLRKLVTALVASRNGFKLREGKFPHSYGAKIPNPWLLNTQNRFLRDSRGVAEVADSLEVPVSADAKEFDPLVPVGRPAVQDAEREALMEVACASGVTPVRRPISCFDAFRLLKADRSLIPSHTVYAINLERCIAKLYHPDPEEPYKDQ